ncbi:hypothetical protein FVEN_g7693 [Fusarium venenatum]|uniref:NADP-dependent oxidoreductase domain-containing protein n=1 Tax=Fusarium venenatum TaxID=56646 RepID=A0A2L2TS21_9HYPO|nr:uncharacterized protein FVRRES_08114 [Fusarium venenatum]KAG8354259.1 hypothetical protein FVEN_g7693 [Fusarium venenatum]KAH6964900.1 NADP-dependent oxidoreductase domain-containing protein [Fusarium venenatum]CEI68037.1 unnamed protein product [Fusarium venenatum]
MVPLAPILLPGKTPIPHFIYGTAWKWEKTADNVLEALHAGFRAIDTAPQSQNYNEALVGKALSTWLTLHPEEDAPERRIFLQSKFTDARGYKDFPKPFEDNDSPLVQVEKSLNQTLAHLGRGDAGQQPLDALLLHSPLETIDETMAYWAAMEAHVPSRVSYLGICNVSLPTFSQLYERATIKPVIVQNDFRPAHGFDISLLEYCRKRDVVYQAYAVLKGNMTLLESPLVRWLAHERGMSEPEALYCLLLSCWDGRLCILNGTRKEEAMRRDFSLIKNVGKLDKYIIDGFWEAMSSTESIDWPSDKSV